MRRIEIVQGDITRMEVDAVVNAANASLRGGGGVDGAIHRAGGPAILAECVTIGGCETGQAVATTAGEMPAGCVIHTVGPIWNGGDNNEAALLADCYRNALRVGANCACKTIAFPNISTGVYGFPKDLAARVSVEAIRSYLKEDTQFETVFLVCFDEENYQLLKMVLSEIHP